MSFISKLKQFIVGNQNTDINELSNSSNMVFNFNNEETTVFYKNGLLVNVIPMPQGHLYDNRDVYYEARYIVSDGHKHDLEDVKSIESIKTPKFNTFDSNSLGISGNMVYVLRMKAFRLKNKGKIDAAVALLKRMTEMMPVSGILWNKEDYLEFPNLLMSISEFEAAKNARKCIDDLFETSFDLYNQTHNTNMKNAELLDTDLVEAEYFNACCSECAKYRGRWFSISGKDKRFPKMPVDYGCTCIGLEFFPVIEGSSEPIYCPKGMSIIKYSNRPFIDDRTDQEKSDYIYWRKEADNEEWFEQYSDRLENLKDYDRSKFEQLQYRLPDIAPKTFSGYMRMKNSNSKNYQKINKIAAEVGIFLDYPEKMKKEVELLKTVKEQYLQTKSDCKKYWDSKKR